MATLGENLGKFVLDAKQELLEDVTREVQSIISCMEEKSDDVSEVAHYVKNLVGEQVDGVTETVVCGLRQLLHPDEVDEAPTTEVHVPHPVTGHMIPLGCNLTITKNGHHEIHNIQSGSLAHKLSFKESDVLFQIDDERVNMWSLAKVIQYLAEREATFIIVLKRKKPESDNEFVYIKIRVQLSIEGDTIQAEITGTTFLKPYPVYGPGVELLPTGYSFDAYIFQEVNRGPSRYVNIRSSTPYVTSVGSLSMDQYKFKTHQLRGWDRTVFVFHNTSLSKAIHAPGPSGYASLTHQNGGITDGRQNSGSEDIIADGRMFYVTSPANKTFQYESVIHAGSYLAYSGGRLVLSRNSNSSTTWFKTVRIDEIDPTEGSSNDKDEYEKPNIIHK